MKISPPGQPPQAAGFGGAARRSENLAELAELLVGFARIHPAGAEMDGIRREGRRAGYPACCIEFFVAVVPLRWLRVPEAMAYWDAAGRGRGFIPCPACAGLNFSPPGGAEPRPAKSSHLRIGVSPMTATGSCLHLRGVTPATGNSAAHPRGSRPPRGLYSPPTTGVGPWMTKLFGPELRYLLHSWHPGSFSW